MKRMIAAFAGRNEDFRLYLQDMRQPANDYFALAKELIEAVCFRQ
jgi:hypothetical protein